VIDKLSQTQPEHVLFNIRCSFKATTCFGLFSLGHQQVVSYLSRKLYNIYNTMCNIKSLFIQRDLVFVYRTLLYYKIIFLNIEYECRKI
jgi:hypothetical protein